MWTHMAHNWIIRMLMVLVAQWWSGSLNIDQVFSDLCRSCFFRLMHNSVLRVLAPKARLSRPNPAAVSKGVCLKWNAYVCCQ